MFKVLLVLLIAVPLVELYVLLAVGGWIGALPTVACVILTAVLGVALVRTQGINNWYRLQERLRTGELPAEELVTGVMLLFAGILLLVPGFVTDAAGFLLLLPPLRRVFWRRFMARHVYPAGRRPGGGVTIHYHAGEYEAREGDHGHDRNNPPLE